MSTPVDFTWGPSITKLLRAGIYAYLIVIVTILYTVPFLFDGSVLCPSFWYFTAQSIPSIFFRIAHCVQNMKQFWIWAWSPLQLTVTPAKEPVIRTRLWQNLWCELDCVRIRLAKRSSISCCYPNRRYPRSRTILWLLSPSSQASQNKIGYLFFGQVSLDFPKNSRVDLLQSKTTRYLRRNVQCADCLCCSVW